MITQNSRPTKIRTLETAVTEERKKARCRAMGQRDSRRLTIDNRELIKMTRVEIVDGHREQQAIAYARMSTGWTPKKKANIELSLNYINGVAR